MSAASDTKASDCEYREHLVERVQTYPDGGLEIRFDGGWVFLVPAWSRATPQVGSVARFYGRGIGFPVRGLDIDGVEVFYRTEEEDHAKHEREVAERKVKQLADYNAKSEQYEKDIAALPEPLRRRIARFRAGNAEFWEFLPYELFTCQQAVLIADAMRREAADDGASVDVVGLLNGFHKQPYEEQRRRVTGLSDGHSGNTFGMACLLARWLLKDPELAVREHGALVPLVGCEAYGCIHAVGASS